MSELLEPGRQEDTGRLVRLAYGCSVDVDTAARHLWRLHQEARVRRAQRVRRTLSSALAATLLFVSTGAAVAGSGGSVPGDTLYPVKRGAERVHLLVSFAPESDARLHLQFARARLNEAQRVMRSRPQRVPVLLGEVVAAVGRAEEAGGAVVVDEIHLVRAEVTAALTAMSASGDADVAAAIDRLAGQLENPAVAGGPRELPGGGTPAGDDGDDGDPGGDEGTAGSPAASDRAASPDRTAPPPVTRTPEPEPARDGQESPRGQAQDRDEGEAGDGGVALAEAPPQHTARADAPPAAAPPPPPVEAAPEAVAPKAVPDIERLEALLGPGDEP